MTAKDGGWGKSHVHPEVVHEVHQSHGAVMTQWCYIYRAVVTDLMLFALIDAFINYFACEPIAVDELF